MGVYARGPLFPIRTTPRQLPAVDIDPQLLRHIHRNAVSNAAKYGKKGGVVTTEITVKEHWLTLRVINEPGEGHAAVRVNLTLILTLTRILTLTLNPSPSPIPIPSPNPQSLTR